MPSRIRSPDPVSDIRSEACGAGAGLELAIHVRAPAASTITTIPPTTNGAWPNRLRPPPNAAAARALATFKDDTALGDRIREAAKRSDTKTRAEIDALLA